MAVDTDQCCFFSATSGADKVVVSASAVSDLEAVAESPGDEDRKKWAKPANALAVVLGNAALQGTHTIDPSQAVAQAGEVKGEDEEDKGKDGQDQPAGSLLITNCLDFCVTHQYFSLSSICHLSVSLANHSVISSAVCL